MLRMKKLIALLAVAAVALAAQAGDTGCAKDKSACPAMQAKQSCCPAGKDGAKNKDMAKKPVQSPKAGGQS
jgi:hypothetical protein